MFLCAGDIYAIIENEQMFVQKTVVKQENWSRKEKIYAEDS